MILEVHGTPASQGSKRWLPNGRMIEADKKVKPWRHAVYLAVATVHPEGFIPFEGPVKVTAVFLFARPKAHFGTGKNAAVLREGAPYFVTRTPDIDKVLRATLDPLTEMSIWKDDSQVVKVTAMKRYCHLGEVPGAYLEITPA